MKKQTKLACAAVLSVMVFLTGCGGPGQTPAQPQAPQPEAPQAPAPPKTFKVALTVPMSGPLAGIGKLLEPAVKIAAADFNANHQDQVELVTEDCGSEQDSARNAINRALEAGPAAVVLYCSSQQTGAMLPVLQDKNIPTMLLNTSPVAFQSDRNWIFNAIATADVEAAAGLKYLKTKLGKTRIGVVAPNDDVGKAFFAAIDPVAGSLGVQLIKVTIQAGDNDYSGQIATLRRENPEAYLLGALPVETAKLVRQMRQAGVKEPIMSSTAASQSFLKLVEPAEAEGIHSWAGSVPRQSKDPAVQAYVNKYEALAKVPADLLSTHAYDGAMVMFSTVAKAQGDPQQVIDQLHATQGYQGLSGEYSFDASGRSRWETNIVRIDGQKELQVLEVMKVDRAG